MQYTAWEQSRHIEQSYLTALKKLRKFITALINDGDTLDIILNKLSALSNDAAINKWAYTVAKTMVTNTLEENARTWRQAARTSGKGQWLYESQQQSMSARTSELIDRNAQYIKSVPQDVAAQLVKFTGTQAFSDNRSAYKAPEFRALVGDMTENHARLISRTETAKAHAALNRAQAEDLGLGWYIWRSTRDVKTRDSHVFMNGILCRYNDNPNPEALFNKYGGPSSASRDRKPMQSYGNYGPGETFQCRCYDAPVILWRTVTFPHKVHVGGEIIEMTKTAFYDRFGNDIGGKWAA